MAIRVLVIEDDEALARLLCRQLRKAGLSVDHEADGQAGVDRFLAAKAPYNLVLIDGLLPTRTGFTIAEEIRASPRGDHVGDVSIAGWCVNRFSPPPSS